jgi:hypothetical protein
MNKVYIVERVTERDSVIAFIDCSVQECIRFMKRDRDFPREEIWCWSVTIGYSEQAVTEQRIFFDWDGKVLFRKDSNTQHATDVFREKEFLPLKAKLGAQRRR